MPAHFSVVQYLPNPVTDERINVGVLVFSGDVVKARFLQNWRRVGHFGGEDIDFLKDFASRFRRAAEGQLKIPGVLEDFALNEDALREMAGSWMNSIQFTRPKASLEDMDKLLASVAQRYLLEPERTEQRSRGRRTAAKIAARGVQLGLEGALGEVTRELLKRNAVVHGAIESHQFDVVAENGRPYLAAHGISFEIRESLTLDRIVNSIAWAIDDVRNRRKDLPMCVMALPPKKSSPIYDRALHLFSELEAPILGEDEIEGWAEEQGEKVDASALADA